jgi:hypothetical protein
MIFRRTLAIVGAAVAITACTTAASAPVAQAAGSVANSCAVSEPVLVSKKIPTGLNLYRLPCGEGTSGVFWATVKKHPFFVKEAGRAPFCMTAGTYYYPQNKGGAQTVVLTPTARCKR